MKKLLLFLLAIMPWAFSAQAGEYPYLTFETTDGAKVSVPASSLTVTISGTSLTAGGHTFVLTNLSKMYFSSSDMTTGIQSVTAAELDEATEIYDLKGQKVSKSRLTRGVYVVKSKSGNYKIAVK